jgi:hypothetical protein
MNKPSLAIYGPSKSDPSGVVEYISLQRHYLEKEFHCIIVTNHNYQEPSSFDYVLYHLGNNPFHACSFRALNSRPGIILMHEYNNLDYYFSCWKELRRNERDYLLDTAYKRYQRTFKDAKDIIQYIRSIQEESPYSVDFACEDIAIKLASTVIFHSEKIASRFRKRYPARSILTIKFPVEETIPDETCMTRLQLPANSFLFGCFGYIGSWKRFEVLIETWRSWKDRPNNCYLLIVGRKQYDISFPEDENIIHLENIDSNEDFNSLLVSCDCGIQLRYPSVGETSASLSKFIAHSIPVITTETENFGCDKDEYVVQIAPDKNEKCNLLTALKRQLSKGKLSSHNYRPLFSPLNTAKDLSDIILDSS